MQEHLISLLTAALDKLDYSSGVELTPDIQLSRTKDPKHGEFSSNLAMQLAKPLRNSPLKIAEALLEHIPASPNVSKVEIASPGFINFYLNADTQNEIIETILESDSGFGLKEPKGKSVCLEFVSANPTGPLHVGHGRGAAYGASLANILKAVGCKVSTEYYVNDAGRQMDILTMSVYLRYLELAGIELAFPGNGYQGDYIWDIAATLHRTYDDEIIIELDTLYLDVPPDETQGGDREQHVDGLIANIKDKLNTIYPKLLQVAVAAILGNIKQDLEKFRVEYDTWFSESSLVKTNKVDSIISELEAGGKIYNKNQAKWLKTTDYQDEKDRVVVRENGLKTYFASDIAYHKNKFDRGFELLINIWGADHHGYVPRVQASIAAMDYDPDNLKVLLVQFANLYRGKEKLPMSTRSGSFVTLEELYNEVGIDAARFFYIMRKSEQHLDFDLELAKSESNDNPVYYIQYAHARTKSVMRKLKAQDLGWDKQNGLENLNLLDSDKEQALIKLLNQYQDTIDKAARDFAPHIIAVYLQELAAEYHSYYNSYKFIIEDENLKDARLSLVNAIRIIIRNALELLGVSAPDKM